MKLIIWTTAILGALITGILLGRAGALDLTGAFILIVGGAIGAALVYPYAFPKRL